MEQWLSVITDSAYRDSLYCEELISLEVDNSLTNREFSRTIDLRNRNEFNVQS